MDEPLCLIVDDESAIRTYLGILLRQKGIKSLEAGDAIEALRILQKLGNEIDLLITDIQMPGELNGVDLAHAVKKLFSSLPVILISGTVEKAPTGFTLVRKPFRSDAILSAIDKALMGTRAGSAR